MAHRANPQIVPGSSNQLAIELLVSHVKRQLDSRSLRFRKLLANMESSESKLKPKSAGWQKDSHVVLLEQTNQLKVSDVLSSPSFILPRYAFFHLLSHSSNADGAQGIMTILRDETTERGDFIFYADRLSTLIVEKGLSLIPYQDKSVKTPVGLTYDGVEAKEKVSILSAVHILCCVLAVRADAAAFRK